MSKYIGTPVVSLSTDTVDVTGDITTTDATPEVIIVNDTHEDTDGGREGKVTFKGQQSGGEETTLAQIQASHDGTSDDEKGDLIFKTNDGSDGASPTERMRIDSAGEIKLTGNISNTSGDFTLDVDGDIILDANGAQLRFKDDGTEIGVISNSSNDLQIVSSVSDADMIFRGNDGGTPFNALTLDMSASGDATFNGSLTFGDGHFIGNGGGDNLEIISSSAENIVMKSAGGIFSFNDNSSNEYARFDTSGNLLVGHNTNAFGPITDGGSGVSAMQNGQLFAGMAGIPLYVNREDSDGGVAIFRKDGARVGKIFVGGRCAFISDNGASGGGLLPTSIDIRPTDRDGNLADNLYDLGAATVARFDDVHATNGTIQTSDEREKQQIAVLTDEEITAAKAISKLFKTYKWNSSVEEKGDAARTHSGVIAQQVQTAMSDAGLDEGDYAFFINTVWWETRTDIPAVEADPEKGIEAENARVDIQDYYTEEEAPEGAVKKTRMGIRYHELLSFIGAATEQRLTSIESRLTALEGE